MVDEPETPPGPDPAPVKFYGLFTVDGKTQGFWSDEIHPPKPDGSRNDKIPPEAVELTRAQWEELVVGQATARFVNGEITYPLSAQPLGKEEYDWGLPLVTVIGKPQ